MMRLVGYVARKGNVRIVGKTFFQNLEGNRSLEKNLDVGKIILLKWFLKQCGMMEATDEFLLAGRWNFMFQKNVTPLYWVSEPLLIAEWFFEFIFLHVLITSNYKLTNGLSLVPFPAEVTKLILSSKMSGSALGSTQPTTKWVQSVFFLELKQPGREADHCTLFSTVQRLRMKEQHVCFPYIPSWCA